MMSKPPEKDVFRLVSDDKRVLAKGTKISLAEICEILGGTIIHKEDLNGLKDDYNNRG